jgi:hypothetical protein
MAVAAVSNLPYNYVWAKFSKHGRKFQGRTQNGVTDDVLNELNIWRDRIDPNAKTVRTFTRENPTGRYLVWTRGHILAVVNGQAIDWTRNRTHRVIGAMKITF